jgi:16S rRNA C967 or C1407 C5-methylase (RsmB/RsmF family)
LEKLIELSSNISEYIKSLFGEDFLSNYEEFVESKYPTIIRISESPENHDNLLTSLARQGIELNKIKTVPNAYEVIKGEENIGKTIEHTLGQVLYPKFIFNDSTANIKSH